MSDRFKNVQYDTVNKTRQFTFMELCRRLETEIDREIPTNRSRSIALTKLEECAMWIGKALRDDQLEREKDAA